MFQRQLSTNALTTGSTAQAGASGTSPSSTGTVTPKAGAAHGPRLFQRQMTASQLFGSGSTSGSGATAGGGGGGQLDKKRLLTSARADLDLARSAANLTTAAQQAAGGPRPASARLDETAAAKKPAKNKRIISRMLSISAIHTSVGSNNAAAAAAAASGANNNGDIGQQQHHHHEAGYQSDEPGSMGEPLRNSDKFDSSFRRSRSSSTSSTAGQQQQQQQAAAAAAAGGGGAGALEAHNSSNAVGETIQCIAFVDAGQAGGGGGAAALASGGTPTGAAAPASLGPASGGGGGGSSVNAMSPAAGQVQSSAGANHKSLSPIDASQQAGQLALWLGTSAGGVLLLNLQMPDTEDNRVLQLQSINAEPIPQASAKLSGQILCLATFTCEARAQLASGQQQAGASGASSGLGSMAATAGAQSASQSSSLEGDTLAVQSPGSSGSSNSASGGGGGGVASNLSAGGSGSSGAVLGGAATPSGGGAIAAGRPFHGESLDARSSLFLAIVSEKQARIYQIPPAPSSPGQPAASAQSESPMASLLSNKRNLIAECELSESSFACRSQVVQMRTPDESCLVSYLANGNLIVHALPRLRPVLMDADFVAYTHSRISSSMQLARNGHGLYQPSAGELCKFTLSAQYKAMVNDMLGLVYVPRDMPEMPRTNFFKSLFSGSQSAKQSDRDELFGECSAGRPTRGVAKHLGSSGQTGASGLDKLKGAAVGTMGHEMRVAREGLDERGEKLGEIEDRTLNMMNSAEGYSQAAHQLAQKFKDKKWYQF